MTMVTFMTSQVKIYLAGPMTGIKDFNFPAFDKAAKELEDAGYIVFNPAANDRRRYGDDFLQHPERFDRRATMFDDTSWICNNANIIALLPGWERSKGVAVEKALAEYLGLEIRYL